MQSQARVWRYRGIRDGFAGRLDDRILRIPDDGAGGIEETVRNDLRRQWPNFRGEPLSPCLRPDPRGPRPECATRLHIRGLVADHPRAPRTGAEVPSRRQEHPGPRLPACAVRQDVVWTVVDLRDVNARLVQRFEHAVVDPRELRLWEQFPPGGILVRHDHQLPTAVLEQPHAVHGTREELKLVRRPNVPGPSAVDDAVWIEEHRGTV